MKSIQRNEDAYAELYAVICDVVERAYQHRPVKAREGEPLHTSSYARAAALRVMNALEEVDYRFEPTN